MLKRLFDLVVAISLLTLVSPILFIVALCIFVLMGRPIIFRQSRPGLNSQLFTLYKFRTMLISDSNGIDTAGDANRLTWLGKILRNTSIDELPELYNVIKGEMSLVGPRPLLVEYLPLYNPNQAIRHSVLPGVTGWAQVNGRNAISWAEKLSLDVWYVQNRTFWLDLKILFMTLVKVLSIEGVQQKGHATVEKFTGTN